MPPKKRRWGQGQPDLFDAPKPPSQQVPIATGPLPLDPDRPISEQMWAVETPEQMFQMGRPPWLVPDWAWDEYCQCARDHLGDRDPHRYGLLTCGVLKGERCETYQYRASLGLYPEDWQTDKERAVWAQGGKI